MKIWLYVCLISMCVGCTTASVEEGVPMQESRPAKLLFMSPAHVMEMNLLLAESAEFVYPHRQPSYTFPVR